jgi:hypothetical protein
MSNNIEQPDVENIKKSRKSNHPIPAGVIEVSIILLVLFFAFAHKIFAWIMNLFDMYKP